MKTCVHQRQPLVLDVGMPLPEVDDTPGGSRHRWRDVYRNDILPKLVAFDPDIILVSAGFDAHKKVGGGGGVWRGLAWRGPGRGAGLGGGIVRVGDRK